MTKNVKFIILVFFLFLGIQINVNAEYAYCYYGISPNDDDLTMPTYYALQSKKKASVVLLLFYDSEKDDLTSPKLVGRIIPTSEADFSDGYAYESSDNIKYELISKYSAAGDNSMFEGLPSINMASMRDNYGKLTCPNIYLYKDTSKYGFSKWRISLNKNEEGYQKMDLMSPDSNYSKISNDDPPSQEVATTCKYRYSVEYPDAIFDSEGDELGELQFSILKDGTVYEITAFSGYDIGSSFTYEGSKIESLECPTYLKVEQYIYDFDTDLIVKNCDDDNCNATYIGAISTADDNKLSFKYTSLKDTEKIISVTVDINGFKASFEGEDITINNKDLINNTTPPKYILYKDGQYTFTDTIDKSGDDLFASSGAYTGLKELTSKEIEATCNALFGGSEGGFMTFLKENVFKIIYIVVPIILLVLTTIDFSKVVFNDDKDGIKNAWKRFGKRTIAAILVYLTPTILIFIADVIGANDVNSCIKAIRNYSESDN